MLCAMPTRASGIRSPDRRGGFDVRAEHVLEGPGGRGKTALARRDLAAEISADQEDDGLVEGDPEPDGRSESLGRDLRESPEPGNGARILPASLGPEPTRVGVVTQRDTGLDAEPREDADPLPLGGQSFVAEPAGLGLDATALERVAVGVRSEGRQEAEVAPPALAVPGGAAAAGAADLEAFEALPLGPVVVAGPLDLVRRSRDAPEEGRKAHVSEKDASPGGAPAGRSSAGRRQGSSVAWCFTHRASAMKIVSSQMLVARSPTRSRFFEIEMSSMQ